jgi:hypothetical protein
MTELIEFVAALARTRKGNYRHSNMKKNKPRGDTVASFAAAVQEDCPETVCVLASALGQSKDTISRILFEDLGLVKKSSPAACPSC